MRNKEKVIVIYFKNYYIENQNIKRINVQPINH
jgi:hypothetical protein